MDTRRTKRPFMVMALVALAALITTPAATNAGETLIAGDGSTIAGVVLDGVHKPEINADGTVVFIGYSDSFATAHLMTVDGVTGTEAALLSTGDSVAIGSTSLQVTRLYDAGIDDAGYAYVSVQLSAAPNRAVLRISPSGATIEAVYAGVLADFAVNGDGDVALLTTSGLYRYDPDTGSSTFEIARIGGIVDGTALAFISDPVLSNDGTLSFFGRTSATPEQEGIWTTDGLLFDADDTVAGKQIINQIGAHDVVDGHLIFVASAVPVGGGTGARYVFDVDLDTGLSSVLIGPGDLPSGVHPNGRTRRNDDGLYVVQTLVSGQGGAVYLYTFNEAPVADAGSDQTVECTSSSGTSVTLDGTDSYDPDNDTLTYAWSAAGVTFDDATSAEPTGTFPDGQTLVTLVVSDGNGEIATDDVLITVEDTVDPVVTCTTDLVVLWPPKGDMRVVEIFVAVSDACSDPSAIDVDCAVSSDEADNAPGLGATVLTGDVDGEDGYSSPVSVDLTYNSSLGGFVGTVSLRAERTGSGDGRTYSIAIEATDEAGNTSLASCVVLVPHSQKKN